MKKPTNRRPEAEPLESLVLLSTFVSGPRPAMAVVYQPVAASSPVAPAATRASVVVGYAAPPVGAAATATRAPVAVGHASPPAIPGFVPGYRVTSGVGHASPPSATATTAFRPKVIASGSAPGQGGTVHAMVLPGGHAVAIGHGSTTAPVAPQAARVSALGHGSVGLKHT